jgi:hypothetical protein
MKDARLKALSHKKEEGKGREGKRRSGRISGRVGQGRVQEYVHK